MRAAWRTLAGRRDLRLVLSAGIISMTGDWVLTIGLIYRVYAATGSTVASALTMASSFAPQVLLALVRTSGRAASREGGPVRARLGQVGAELRDGLRLATRNQVLRALMFFALVTSVGEGTMSTLFTPFVEHVLHGTPQDLGLTVAAQAVGGIVGGASGHRMRAGRLLSYGAVAFGLVDLAIFLYPLGYAAVWPAVAGMIIVGLPGALALAGLITLFQRSSEDSYRGRVFGAVSALEGVTVLAGTLGAGYLSRLAGIIPVLAIQGGGYVVAGLAMLFWLRGEPGPVVRRAAEVPGHGERALVTADEGVRPLP